MTVTNQKDIQEEIEQLIFGEYLLPFSLECSVWLLCKKQNLKINIYKNIFLPVALSH
jgi:hypothetical protein